VGGVRGRAGARGGGSNLRALACRSGGRHPGHRDGGALRGASSERVTSVGPSRPRGHPPAVAFAPMTADVRRTPRRGTSSACATKRMHLTASTSDRACLRDASFARSFDPCASILTMHERRKASRGGAFGSVSRLGKPARAGGTSTGAGRMDARGSPRVTAPARERAWHVRKGRRSRPPSLRGFKSPGSCSHVVFSCRSR